MPLDRLVLIVVCVIVTAAATLWLAAFLSAALSMPLLALPVAVPVALIAWVAWRVIAARLNNAEDDHYDRIEK